MGSQNKTVHKIVEKENRVGKTSPTEPSSITNTVLQHTSKQKREYFQL